MDADIRKQYDQLQELVTRVEADLKAHSLKKTITHKASDLKEDLDGEGEESKN